MNHDVMFSFSSLLLLLPSIGSEYPLVIPVKRDPPARRVCRHARLWFVEKVRPHRKQSPLWALGTWESVHTQWNTQDMRGPKVRGSHGSDGVLRWSQIDHSTSSIPFPLPLGIKPQRKPHLHFFPPECKMGQSAGDGRRSQWELGGFCSCLESTIHYFLVGWVAWKGGSRDEKYNREKREKWRKSAQYIGGSADLIWYSAVQHTVHSTQYTMYDQISISVLEEREEKEDKYNITASNEYY